MADLSKAFRKPSLTTIQIRIQTTRKREKRSTCCPSVFQKLKNEETKTEALKASAKKAFEKISGRSRVENESNENDGEKSGLG